LHERNLTKRVFHVITLFSLLKQIFVASIYYLLTLSFIYYLLHLGIYMYKQRFDKLPPGPLPFPLLGSLHLMASNFGLDGNTSLHLSIYSSSSHSHNPRVAKLM